MQYEIAVSKSRQENPQILACLARVYLLKGKQDKDLAAMMTALDYSRRSLAIAPDQTHLEFNVAFVQFQIAQMVNALAETQRTLEDVQAAADGLEEAIEAFNVIAKSKTPPYPRSALEQRANMGRNTMRKQLERAVQSQKDYEEKNASKLHAARESRENARKEREERVQQERETELAKAQELAKERRALAEQTQQETQRQVVEQRLMDEAEMTTDEETGDKVKRKKRQAEKKRKKKDDDIVSDGEISSKRARSSRSHSAVTSNADEPRRAPKKKRRLEKRPIKDKASKYKSSEIVVESDSDEGVAAPPANGVDAPTPRLDGDADMPDRDESEPQDDAVQVRRKRATARVLDSDEEEDGLDSAEVPAANGHTNGDDAGMVGDDVAGDGED